MDTITIMVVDMEYIIQPIIMELHTTVMVDVIIMVVIIEMVIITIEDKDTEVVVITQEVMLADNITPDIEEAIIEATVIQTDVTIEAEDHQLTEAQVEVLTEVLVEVLTEVLAAEAAAVADDQICNRISFTANP